MRYTPGYGQGGQAGYNPRNPILGTGLLPDGSIGNIYENQISTDNSGNRLRAVRIDAKGGFKWIPADQPYNQTIFEKRPVVGVDKDFDIKQIKPTRAPKPTQGFLDRILSPTQGIRAGGSLASILGLGGAAGLATTVGAGLLGAGLYDAIFPQPVAPGTLDAESERGGYTPDSDSSTEETQQSTPATEQPEYNPPAPANTPAPATPTIFPPVDLPESVYDSDIPISWRLASFKNKQVSPDTYQSILNALYKDTFADPVYYQQQYNLFNSGPYPPALGGIGDKAYQDQQAQDWKNYVQKKLDELGISQTQVTSPEPEISAPETTPEPEPEPAPVNPASPTDLESIQNVDQEQAKEAVSQEFLKNYTEQGDVASIYPAGMTQKELYDALNYGKGLDPINRKQELIDVQKEWIRRQQGGQKRVEEKFGTAIAKSLPQSDEKRQLETFQSEFDPQKTVAKFDPQKAREAVQAASNYRVGSDNKDPFRKTTFV